MIDQLDLDLRNVAYGLFVRLGRAPSVDEVAAVLCAALGSDGTIETLCPDCGDPIHAEVRAGRPSDDSLVFHCLVPRRGGGTTSSSPEAG